MSESTWDDPRITAYVLGELSGDEKTAFEAECQSDRLLAAAVDEARGVTGQLQAFYASESTPPLDARRRDAIVSGDHKVSLPRSGSSWRVSALVLAAAAVLLLLVGIAPWLRQQDATVAMDDSNLTKQNSIAESEGLESSSEVVRLEALKQEEKSPTSRALSVSMDDSPEAGQAEEFSLELSTAAPVAMPSEPAVPPAGPMAGSDKALDAAKPSLWAVQPESGRDARAKAAESRSARSLNEQIQQPAPMASPFAEQVSDESSGYRGEQERKSVVVAEEMRIRQPMAKAAVEAEVEAAREQGSVVISGNKSDATRLRQSTKEFARPTPEQPAAAAPAAPRTASPKPAGMHDLDSLQASSGLASGQAGALGGALQNSDHSVRRFVPALGKNPTIQGDADFEAPIAAGRGPGISGDQFEPITDNPFKRVSEEPVSTFSVDVDTASYSKTRDFLMRANQLPRPDAVRIEELINYFQYDYKAPKKDAEHPFATYVEVTDCPWNPKHRLARIGLKGKTMTADERPPCNLVFLLDTSGSMNAANKLPLVIEGMKMLVDQLTEKDQVAITVYAGSAGLVLDSTSAKKTNKILKALTELSAGGSTNGGAGIALAYQTARDHFISAGVNRVILCTDGDFNVGVTGTDALVRMVEQEAKGGVFLSVLGFGMGNHNDAMLEQISGRGNGNYAFIDTQNEAHKVLVDQTSGTLVTIAKDVKMQIEFNPKHVAQYRLIGYENRILAKEDFNDDKKDAGEIGAGHAVTALYELVPAGTEADASQPKVDDLKYQTNPQPTKAADSDEMMTLKLRYKQPDGDASTLVEIPVADETVDFDKASDDVRFAAAVAGFGMQLRRSPYAGTWTLSDVEKVAKSATGEDDYRLRAEFVDLVRKASELMGQE